jgi:hypothetical protein
VRKSIKQIIKLTVTVVVAILVTFITWFIPFGSHPKIVKLSQQVLAKGPFCNLPSDGIGPPPTHRLGFPIPYITRYAGGDCGWQQIMSWGLFMLDVVIWLVVLIVLIKMVKHAKNDFGFKFT